MKKITLGKIQNSGEALTRDQLKMIIGGDGGSQIGSGGSYEYLICQILGSQWVCYHDDRSMYNSLDICRTYYPDYPHHVTAGYWVDYCAL